MATNFTLLDNLLVKLKAKPGDFNWRHVEPALQSAWVCYNNKLQSNLVSEKSIPEELKTPFGIWLQKLILNLKIQTFNGERVVKVWVAAAKHTSSFQSKSTSKLLEEVQTLHKL